MRGRGEGLRRSACVLRSGAAAPPPWSLFDTGLVIVCVRVCARVSGMCSRCGAFGSVRLYSGLSGRSAAAGLTEDCGGCAFLHPASPRLSPEMTVVETVVVVSAASPGFVSVGRYLCFLFSNILQRKLRFYQ